jgi:type VI secretion system protein ImpA
MDIEALLKPVAEEAPTGEDLEYDPEFGELTRSAQVKAEQVIGDHVKEAEEPEWKVVRKQAEALFARTKDLRVAVHLTNAALRIDGWNGLNEGLQLIRQLSERYWETVHPRLDEDDGDPTIRVNAVRELANRAELVLRLLDTPFIRTRVSGNVCLRDLRVIAGKMSAKAGSPSPGADLVAAAVREAGLEEVGRVAECVRQASEAAAGIEEYYRGQVGAVDAPDLKALQEAINEVNKFLAEHLPDAPAEVAEGVAQFDGAPAGGESPAAAAAVARPVTGDVTSRDDVVRMLDKICSYYAQVEPSSPVPLLLRRARSLVNKGFMEILADLTPGGLSQAEHFKGTVEPDVEPAPAARAAAPAVAAAPAAPAAAPSSSVTKSNNSW